MQKDSLPDQIPLSFFQKHHADILQLLPGDCIAEDSKIALIISIENQLRHIADRPYHTKNMVCVLFMTNYSIFSLSISLVSFFVKPVTGRRQILSPGPHATGSRLISSGLSPADTQPCYYFANITIGNHTLSALL